MLDGWSTMEAAAPAASPLVALPPDVLAVLLAPLPALSLARLRGACRLLRSAASTAAAARFAALRPPSAAFDRPAAAAGEESAVAYEEGCAQWLHALEGRCGRELAIGGFDTTRMPAGGFDTPDDDMHDAEGCLSSLEHLWLLPEGTVPAADPAGSDDPLDPPPLTTQRTDLGAVALPGGWVFAIGGRCGAEDHDTVERFDAARGSWTAVEPMLQPLSGLSAARLGRDRLLVAGGACRASYRSTSLVQIYSARDDSWSIAADMSQFRVFSAAVAASPTQVVVLGGASRAGASMGSFQGSHSYDPRIVEVYDGESDRWSPGPRLEAARYGCAAATAPSGRIIVVGGLSQDEPIQRSEGVDLRTASISALAPLPSPDARELWGAAALGTPAGVACIGGAVSAESSARVWLYDERADRWEAGTGMATARWCGAAARIVGRE